ncbi:MAG: carboxypeptidase-like regulatory domain-containing protein [Bryobacteraceae bacterium]|nr:carboxypeptidase-like regulatory domain-containing protein [Bryobacteraceae bacterium]
MIRNVPVLLALAIALHAQVPQKPPDTPPPLFKGEKKDQDPNGRAVEGVVRDDKDAPVSGAVVKLKDLKSLQVRSFITTADGKFRFTSLRKDVDYELKADFNGQSSAAKTASVFDTRKLLVFTLKLEPRK